MKLKNYKTNLLNLFSILFILLGFGVTPILAQDTCSSALPISSGTYTVAAVNGTNGISICSSAGGANAEWYVYSPTENHLVTITSDLIQNICRDTHLRIFSGTCSTMNCVGIDDDSGVIQCNTTNSNSYLSVKTFEAYAGISYYIVWDNQWDSLGFDFQLIENALVPSPCATATPVSAGITTVTAIDGNNIFTSCSNSTLANWYAYTPTQNYHVTVSSDLIQNICKDTNFSIYTGSCTGTLTCLTSDDNSGIIECNSGNTNSFLSKKTFDVNAGTTYFIAWDNKWSTDGFDFEITELPIIVPVNYTTQNIPTVNSNYNICVVDMNGDHLDDIVGVNNNSLRVNYQNSNGTFSLTEYPFSGVNFMPSWSMAAGDYNKDGYNDLVLGSGSGLSILRSNNTGTAYTGITPGEYIFCQRTNFADLNKDGNLDVFSCHDIDDNVYYLNDGNGGLTYYQSNTTAGSMNLSAGGGNYATLFTDFDNDGDSDMFISKCSGPPCQLFRYDGGNNYTNVSIETGVNVTPIQTWSSAISDFDNDGDMDVIITASSGTHRFFRNNLEVTNVLSAFTNITLGSGWDTNTTTNIDNIAYDFDNDGFVDVLGGGNKIMFNNGDGTFSGTIYNSGLSVGAVGDLNNDGFLDILNGTNVRYAVPNGNNWLKVALQGIESNSNGIGARIEIYGSWGKQIRDIRSGEGFKYMSSLNAHFGIGTATTIDQVIIRWSSGIVDTYTNVTPNEMLTVVEGATLAVGSFTNAGFSIFPNPTNKILNITSSANISFKSAQVFDLTGRLVLESQLENATINVEKLSSGSYILLLRDENNKDYSQKFIKE